MKPKLTRFYYAQSKILRAKGHLVGNKKVGEWEFYTSQGRMHEKGQYDKKGRRIGTWQRLDWSSGKIFLDTYQNGKIKTKRLYKRINKNTVSSLPESRLSPFESKILALWEQNTKLLDGAKGLMSINP